MRGLKFKVRIEQNCNIRCVCSGSLSVFSNWGPAEEAREAGEKGRPSEAVAPSEEEPRRTELENRGLSSTKKMDPTWHTVRVNITTSSQHGIRSFIIIPHIFVPTPSSDHGAIREKGSQLS